MKFLWIGLERAKLTLAAAFLLCATGLVAWRVMPRMEDPRIPERNALLITVYPGADPEQIARLVADPLEEQLAEVDSITRIESEIRAEVVVTTLKLRGFLDDDQAINAEWDEVRRHIHRATLEFPAGVLPPILDTDILETEAVLLAVTGIDDPLALMETAEKVKKALLQLDSVAAVKIAGDPGDQITVAFDDAQARRLGLNAGVLAQQLQQRNLNQPGGSVKTGGLGTFLRPRAEFRDLEDLRTTPIVLPSGAAVPLHSIARVERGPREPIGEIMRVNGRRAVGLGVVPVDNINLVTFGNEVRALTEDLKSRVAPFTLTEVTFQPARVADRLQNLSLSLLLGIAVVSLVLVSTMGLRLGLVVASVVPMIALASVALFFFSGGILHQLSIAALVIALGLLVDNAIVMAESIQWHLDHGLDGVTAAKTALRELALPLLAATGTTLAAFVPMLLAEGDVGSFTRDIPRVIMITLAVSYFFALCVTPTLSARFQKQLIRGEQQQRWDRLAAISVNHPRKVLLAVGLVLITAALGATRMDQQFFPYGDRNQLLVSLELPVGSHIQTTTAAAEQLERLVKNDPFVVGSATFIGRSAPQFYYNLPKYPAAPHLAQVLLTTQSTEGLAAFADRLRGEMQRLVPEAVTITRIMEQGPPVDAPIEIRISSEDARVLEQRTEAVVAILERQQGVHSIRHNLGRGQPTLTFRVNDAAAGRGHLSRGHVAQALGRQTRGILAGQFREADDPVPILVRGGAGEFTPLPQLASLDIANGAGSPVPLQQVARFTTEWVPSVIHHRNRARTVTVSANLATGTRFNQVIGPLKRDLGELTWDTLLRYELGGAVEASDTARGAILRNMPTTLLLLVFILLAEFNRFREVAIVMITIPLSAIGVIPGLLLFNQPFGFMSLLGVLALAGIVVNNAIVLIEVVKEGRAAGLPLPEAVRKAVRKRTRPILLTTATTVAGLLPLALSSSSLWPPMAWAMISGLLSATMLTLLVVPALYLVLFRNASEEVVV
ncbi:efflux RND transporter permease subunit [Acanthopleuribacter pedis]|uniref:Efflux RND transporter permease subunit n=1 Tax=Acanthopleuribacter pedis TaxID=442870 RepID=A0A8J7QJB1_9BACT|nr:efflux RND transporter permease subunit [Acanthopleuribacter pedis]MBO1319240.1 efflux RND transporter permease subunit [Acanthopleuribacter pedis]